MSFLTNRLGRGSQVKLSPAITPEEERWWSVERKKHFRAHVLRMGLPMFLVFTLGAAITKPEKLVLMPVFAAIALGTTWLVSRTAQTAKRDQEVRWKRIREPVAAGGVPA